MTTPTAESVQATASRLLGFELREPQLHAVRAVLDGRDTLAVLPTGAGRREVIRKMGSGGTDRRRR